eukprot:TRINITY_DN33526_c0_g1_i1.p1 TRINITY_DN33526_c0_g1~~TRINITY_DN33526_c0_g1_i1.p1  ORF type:complete len:260 (+),score=80.96 TRINITY_DN33526_c0_g1_i1:54-782(+)
MNGNLAKAAFIAFGVFALMAISASTGARKHAASMNAIREVKKADIDQPVDDVKISATTPDTTRQVETQAQPVSEQNKDVNLNIHINVHKEEPVAVKEETGKLSKKDIDAINEKISIALNAEPVKEAVKEQAAVKETEVKAKEEVKEVEVKSESVKAAAPVKAAVETTETTAAAVKTVKPASASVLMIPMLALIAAMVAIKYRKPGYLPEVFEDKLEDFGLPASSSSSSPWSSAPSRSMYGAV